jgi:CRP-like cAMP-binding protein
MLLRSKHEGQPAAPRAAGVVAGVDRIIARLNIEHFRKRLSEEKDEAKRHTIRRLLAEEEAKLATLDKPSGSQH